MSSKSLTKKMLKDVMPEDEKPKKKGGSSLWDDDWRGGYDDLYGSKSPSYMDDWDRSKGYSSGPSYMDTWNESSWRGGDVLNEAKQIIDSNSGGASNTIALDQYDSDALGEVFRGFIEDEFNDAGIILTQDALVELRSSLLSVLDLCKWKSGVSLFDLKLR